MTLIILPVRNGKDYICNTITDILEWGNKYLYDSFSVLVIDDWSKDGTFDLVDSSFGNKVRLIKNRFDNGKGSAIKTGYVISNIIYRLEDYDNIVFMDSDGQIDPAEIKTFFNVMNLYEADVAIGNKRHLYSSTEYPLLRRIVSRTYNFIIQLLFQIRFQDTQCGIKVFKKRALDAVIDKVNVKKYAFDLELIVALKEQKFRVVDVPVKVKKQENIGSVSVNSIVKTFIDTCIVWIKKKKGHYR